MGVQSIGGIPPIPKPKPTTQQGGNQQYPNEAAQYAIPDAASLAAIAPTIVGQKQDQNGTWWNIDQYGQPVSRYAVPAAKPMALGGTGGPTWYEKQQIALDKQRLADAEAAQAAQLAYQAEQQKIAQSNAVESANQAFRDAQLKSTYGTINGMAYGSPKGSPFVEQLPEPMLLKEAYAASGQTDPWSQQAHFGGYTGSAYMNAQQAGLADQGDPNAQVPTNGTGSPIPIAPTAPSANPWPMVGPPRTGPTPSGPVSMAQGGQVPGSLGQPQLVMAHGGEEIKPAPGTPLPTLLGSPGGAPFSNPLDPSDPNNPSPQGGESINDALQHLIQAAQELVMHPGFKAPIAPPEPSTPGMASGGVVPSYARGGVVSYSNAAFPSSLPSTALPLDNYTPVGQGRTDSYRPVGPPVSQSPVPPITSPVWGGTASVPPAWGGPVAPPSQNAYGQSINPNMVHQPTYNDVNAGPGVLNHMPYSPVLTGLSGYGATMTPDGTPVVMSNWQRSHLMPSSISGPGGYSDYAMQVAGWNPADLQALGTSVTGNFGTDLSAPKNYAPIAINPAPSGG